MIEFFLLQCQGIAIGMVKEVNMTRSEGMLHRMEDIYEGTNATTYTFRLSHWN